MNYRFITIAIALFLPWMALNAMGQEDHEHRIEQGDHATHEHDDAHEHEQGDEVYVEHDALHDHEDELTLTLSPEAAKMAGIEILTTTRSRISSVIELPGEIGFNQDRLAHVAPRFAGIALQAEHRIVDYVETGEVMAVIESN